MKRTWMWLAVAASAAMLGAAAPAIAQQTVNYGVQPATIWEP